VRVTGAPAGGAAGTGMAQIAASNVARVALLNCFTNSPFHSG
jgi:hypothetical protein